MGPSSACARSVLNSSWLPGRNVTRTPSRCQAVIFSTTAPCSRLQCQVGPMTQPSTISPTRKRFSASCCSRNSSSSLALHLRVPRCRSEIQIDRQERVRARRACLKTACLTPPGHSPSVKCSIIALYLTHLADGQPETGNHHTLFSTPGEGEN